MSHMLVKLASMMEPLRAFVAVGRRMTTRRRVKASKYAASSSTMHRQENDNDN